LKTSVTVFSSPYELAEKVAEELVFLIAESAKTNKSFTVALSGGSTPELLYSVLGDHFSQSVQWDNVHFFWGDERCVSPDDPQSNFGMTERAFLKKIKIPVTNIHRIIGENDPSDEAIRYSDEIRRFTNIREELPAFDLIILGLGEDGHTASIFPGNNGLLYSENICEVAVHPESFQKRITLTGPVINNSESVIFLVTGERKAKLVSEILEKSEPLDYPAAHIIPGYGSVKWYLDAAAAKMINRETGNN
jgi:6-phosphogluconolactonase